MSGSGCDIYSPRLDDLYSTGCDIYSTGIYIRQDRDDLYLTV